MASNVSAFPTMTESLMERNNVSIDEDSLVPRFSFSLDEENPDAELGTEVVNGILYTIKDKYCVWSPDTHGLSIGVKLGINNPAGLFGASGVVPTNGTLAVGLRWCSATSKARKIVYMGTIDPTQEHQEIIYTGSFGKSVLRGQVVFSYVFYIKKTCEQLPEERCLANVQGTVVGERQICILEIDSKDNSFPIEYIEDEEAPLWRLFVADEDPTISVFGRDFVRIELNKKHPNFPCIDSVNRSRKYCPALVSEIMASALSQFIEELRNRALVEESLNGILNAEDESAWVPYSVAEVVKSFQKQPMFFDFDSPTATSISIRKYFDSNLNLL